MARRLGVFVIWLLAFVATIALVSPLMAMIPIEVRYWLALIVVPLVLLYFLYAWYRWHRKRVGDANELEWLDELAQQHAKGTRDNRDTLERLIRTIEKNHEHSAALAKRLENVRRILDRRG